MDKKFDEITEMLNKIVGGNTNLFGVNVDPLGRIDCKEVCESRGCSKLVVGTVTGEKKGKDYPVPDPDPADRPVTPVG